MWQYIAKRLLLMIPTLLGAALVIFLLMNIIPGTWPCSSLAATRAATSTPES